jgi:serine/threonine protein kinase
MIGAIIDDFRIVDMIGEGAIGKVYLATQVSLGRQVAIKIIDSNREYGVSDVVDRFLREAKLMASIEHPNIVNIHKVGTFDAKHFIVMEYVDGSNLDELADKGEFSPEDEHPLWELFAAVANGLRNALQNGIIHRDIKPANILISSQGIAKIADFGISKNLDEDVQMTMEGVVLGSPHYISPEQASGKPALYQADMYSLGATAYKMFTGKTLFEGDVVIDILYKQMSNKPFSPLELSQGLSPGTAYILGKMLAKEPGRRHHSYCALIADINSFLAGRKLPYSSEKDAELSFENFQLKKNRMGKLSSLVGRLSGNKQREDKPMLLWVGCAQVPLDMYFEMTKRFDFRSISALQELKCSIDEKEPLGVILNVKQLGMRVLQFLSFLKRKHGDLPIYFRDCPSSQSISSACIPKDLTAKKMEEIILGTGIRKFLAKDADFHLVLFLAEKLSWTCTLKLFSGNDNKDKAYFFFNKGSLAPPSSQQISMLDGEEASSTNWWRLNSWDEIPETIKEHLHKTKLKETAVPLNSSDVSKIEKSENRASKTIQEILGESKKTTPTTLAKNGILNPSPIRQKSVEKKKTLDSLIEKGAGKTAELTGEFQMVWDDMLRKKNLKNNKKKNSESLKRNIEKKKSSPLTNAHSHNDEASFELIMDQALDAVILKDWDVAYDLLLKAKKINPDSPKLKINLKRLEEMGYGKSEEVV